MTKSKNSFWCCFTICIILWISIHVDNEELINSKALVGDLNEVDVGHEAITIVEDKFELKIKTIKETQNGNQSSHAVPRPAAPTIQAILLVCSDPKC